MELDWRSWLERSIRERNIRMLNAKNLFKEEVFHHGGFFISGRKKGSSTSVGSD